MSNWVDKYKKLVISSHKQHIIVADQDNLFGYAELTQAFENDGYTILLSEQNAKKTLQYANRAYVFRTGSIILHGTGKELMDNPVVQQAYLGG